MTPERESLADPMPHRETEPQLLPVIEDASQYYFDRRPEPQEGTIVHCKISDLGGKDRDYFLFQKTIAGLRFIFRLNEYMGTYQLSFKTEEYEYATVDLEATDRDSLFQALAAFIDRASEISTALQEIMVDPANQSYSREEIDQCADLILASPENKFTKEQLFRDYKGFKIFDLYEKIFKKRFHEVHYNSVSRGRGRGRLFKMVVSKYLPDWEITEELGSSFVIRRRS